MSDLTPGDAELERMRAELDDERSRRLASDHQRPAWRAELDDLLLRNRDNPEVWRYMEGVVNMGRDFYAKACRICGRPMPARWMQCEVCLAWQDAGPSVIAGSVIAGEIERA